ncbi:MAG: polysaccharide biosynthesis C-terminal domain-containing protein, partial [Candidatus Pacebacteria bacterium]|nr:polysaccharide biosynthesis C-terminal domain-containing protein [Candidatus Paceibacterota bacterium]
LRAFEEISWYSFIFNISQNVIKILALILFVILGVGSNSSSLSYVAGIFGMILLAFVVSKYKLPLLFGKFKLEDSEKSNIRKEILSYSWPLLFSGIISTLFYWIDSFSIGYYKGAIEVGLYNAAVPIAILMGVVPELFAQLFFPMINKEYSKKNIELIEELSKQVGKWILLINLPIFAIFIIFPGAVLNIVFGPQYLAAESALRILSIGTLMSSIVIISNYLITMIGKTRLVLMNIVIASVVNIVLNSILVPMQKIWFIDNSSGLNGAAIATLISVIILNVLFLIETYKYLSVIPFRRKMLTLFIITALPAALLFYLRTIFVSNSLATLITLSAMFGLVYIGLVFATGALDKNDWMILNSILKKIGFRRL